MGGKVDTDNLCTLYRDIEREISVYIDYDPDLFRGKSILLPCGDSPDSNYTKYFLNHFIKLGIKRLVCTTYNPVENPVSDPDNPGRGTAYALKRKDGSEYVSMDDFQSVLMRGDGDFCSTEMSRLRDSSDFIITTPPLSKTKLFFEWVMDSDVQFLCLARHTTPSTKWMFPLLKKREVWMGRGWSGNFPMGLHSSDVDEWSGLESEIHRTGLAWFTNIEHGRRHKPMKLMTRSENLKYNSKIFKSNTIYERYDNYDVMEVNHPDAIPIDYPGVMAVNFGFMAVYSPDQFDLIGVGESRSGESVSGGTWRGGSKSVTVNGDSMSNRIFIRLRHIYQSSS